MDELEREIDGLGRRRWGEDPRTAEAEAQRRAAALEVRHRRLRASLDALAEQEGATHSWHRRPVTLAEARGSLDEQTTLLTLHLGRDSLLIGVLDRHGFEVVTRPFGIWHARRLVRRLAFHLDRPAVVFDAFAEVDDGLVLRAEEVLATCYQELIAPVIGRLDTQRLVVVPHGPLHAIPFHALMPEAGGRPLLATHDIVTAPSVSIFAHAQSLPQARGRGVTAFGVPDADAPGVVEEARGAADAWPEAIAISGDRATREAVLDALGQRAVVHVASHGTFDDDDPLRAGVRLGDGWLRTSDLYGRDVVSDLVVLSGCVTGRLSVRAADEPMGLIRGFLAAGARQIITTLWHVVDETAQQLMLRMHQRLASGDSTTTALRLAALDVREIHPHPAHWAPFAVLGTHGAPRGANRDRSGS
ncbi:MAG: CHAT domain-containing protein [Myxococcales bacterium]|nr:CHAT domain-containing protein [Myxococcales bacterium]